jgi:PilZ domain
METTLSCPGDRRGHARWRTVGEHGVVLVRVRPGHAATVIDISPAGALLETRRRLLPDTFVEMHVQTRLHRFNVRGRVVRCAVASVRPACVWYRGAVQFDSCLEWIDEDDGYVVHLTGPAGGAVREDRAPEAV